MVGPRLLRRQQDEDQVDRLLVDRVEVDGPFEPREEALDPVDARELAVRDRDPVSDARGPEPLPLQEDVEDLSEAAEPPAKRRQLAILSDDEE